MLTHLLVIPSRVKIVSLIPYHFQRIWFSLCYCFYFVLLMKFLKRIKSHMTGQSSSSRFKMISGLPLFHPHCVQLHLFLGTFGYIVLRRPLLFCSTSCNKPWSIKSPQIIHQIESDSATLLLHLQWWVKHSICPSVLFTILTLKN